MKTVACLLWIGDQNFEGRRYDKTWVYRLRDEVKRRLSCKYRFVCFSDHTIPGIETIPLRTDWRGWWAKMELFNPAHADVLGERCLYLDLDVFCTGELLPLMNFAAPIALAPAAHFFTGKAPQNKPGVVRAYQASVISWSPPYGRELYEELTPEVMTRLRSDQDWIAERMPNLATMPASWFAKSQQCTNGAPAYARVVLAHRTWLPGKTLIEVARQ